MGVGQVISDTFGMVKDRFGAMLGLWAVYMAITIALTVVLGLGFGLAGMGGLAMDQSNPAALGVGVVIFFVLFYIGYILLSMAQTASMIVMASPIQRPSFGDALAAGWRAAPAMLLLMVVLLIGYFVVALGISLVGAAISAVAETASVIAALFILPLFVWLGCRLSVLFAVIAVDGVRNPFTAIGRSWRLTDGHALTIFLASLVFLLVVGLICGVALLPSIGLMANMVGPTGMLANGVEPSIGGIALFFVGLLVAGMVFSLAYYAFMSVIHGTLANSADDGVAESFA